MDIYEIGYRAINNIYLFSKVARHSVVAHMEVYDEEDYG